jgi:CspA family cold shock protein
MRGKVKWWNDQKGYGFIVSDDGGPDAFIHFSGIVGSGHRTLVEDEPVEYHAEETPKGVQAVNVVRLNPA